MMKSRQPLSVELSTLEPGDVFSLAGLDSASGRTYELVEKEPGSCSVCLVEHGAQLGLLLDRLAPLEMFADTTRVVRLVPA